MVLINDYNGYSWLLLMTIDVCSKQGSDSNSLVGDSLLVAILVQTTCVVRITNEFYIVLLRMGQEGFRIWL